MRMTRLFAFSTLLCAALGVPIHAQQVPAAIATDPPPDKTYPASLQTFQLPSHGALLNAFVYVAAGPGAHRTVILLHGFPGNERNLDLAQSIRRGGWNVLYFDYRGSWGSPGAFSFSNALEDSQSAIAFLRDPANAAKLHSDPSYIVLIGHSMGGLMAYYSAAHDPSIRAIGVISATDINAGPLSALKPEQRAQAIPQLAHALADEGLAPLAGCTAESLAQDVIDHAAAWSAVNLAPKIVPRPALIITSDDSLAPLNDAVADILRKAGDQHITTVHLTTDHSYSGQRIALEAAVFSFLATLPQK
jgi:pimeloyl-ACP methyl ester carboxylesterase